MPNAAFIILHYLNQLSNSYFSKLQYLKLLPINM